MSPARPARLALFALAGLDACTEARAIGIGARGDEPGAQDAAPQPTFTAYVPPGPASPDAGPASPEAGVLPIRIFDGLDPVAISDSGAVVAGVRGGRAARWDVRPGATAMIGLTDLPFARADDRSSTASGISADGKVIIGSSGSETRTQPVRWVGPALVEPLGFADATHDLGVASATSGDGKTIVGWSQSSTDRTGSTRRAFVWREGRGLSAQPLPADTSSEALLVSRDGSTVVGITYQASMPTAHRHAFLWRDNQTIMELPIRFDSMVPRGVSADGMVVVGDASDGTNPGQRAFRWTQSGGPEVVPTPSSFPQSRAVAVSSDGTVMVGLAWPTEPRVATVYRWKPPAPPGLFLVDDPAGIFMDGAGETIAGVKRSHAGPPTVVSWQPPAIGLKSLPSSLPSGGEAVALSGDGGVLVGRIVSASTHPVAAWLLTLR